MKKPVIVLISLLAIFCVIYNFSNVTAAEDNDTTTIVDFEDNTEESKGGTKENDKSDHEWLQREDGTVYHRNLCAG